MTRMHWIGVAIGAAVIVLFIFTVWPDGAPPPGDHSPPLIAGEQDASGSTADGAATADQPRTD